MAAEATVVAVSLASAFTFAISTSLKHASASQLARRDDSRIGAWGRFARATLTHPLWLGAIAADAIGFSLQVIALHLGALALVQPLLISGLLFALLLRRGSGQGASRWEILWGLVLTGALGGFLLLARVGNPTKPHNGVNHWPAGIAVTAGILLAGVCIVIGRKRSGSPAAALLGVAVGISYAATAALLKSVTNIALQGPGAGAHQLAAVRGHRVGRSRADAEPGRVPSRSADGEPARHCDRRPAAQHRDRHRHLPRAHSPRHVPGLLAQQFGAAHRGRGDSVGPVRARGRGRRRCPPGCRCRCPRTFAGRGRQRTDVAGSDRGRAGGADVRRRDPTDQGRRRAGNGSDLRRQAGRCPGESRRRVSRSGGARPAVVASGLPVVPAASMSLLFTFLPLVARYLPRIRG